MDNNKGLIDLENCELAIKCDGVVYSLRLLDPEKSKPYDLVTLTIVDLQGKETQRETTLGALQNKSNGDVVRWLAMGFHGIPKRLRKKETI